VVRVSRERRNSEIDPEWADHLIETAQQALALLTTGDTGDDWDGGRSPNSKSGLTADVDV
jgi:hypothetical protein